MIAQRLLFPVCLTLMGWIIDASAQEDVDCARYRVAGLACPTKPAAMRSRLPDSAPLPALLHGLPGLTKLVPPVPTSKANTATTVTIAPQLAPFSTLSTTALQVMPAPVLNSNMLTPMTGTSASSLLFPPVATDSLEPGQVIVYWPSLDAADTALSMFARDRRIHAVSSSRLEHLGGVITVFQLKTQSEAIEFRHQLARDFPGLAVDFNTRYQPFQQAQPRIYLPLKIDLPQINNPINSAAGVRIGIIDGPIRSIAALAGTTIIRKSFLASTDIPASAEHATSIAALISGQDRAAGFAGVAPQAILYSAEIMRSAGQTNLTNTNALVRALDWLLSEKVQVINLSLGGPGDAVMARAFARLAELPVVAVAAAGNGGPDAKPAYPAAYPVVIAVTATDALDNAYSLANQGAYITIAAPGVDLWVPDAGVGHYVSGTSFAAAVVTAASARLLAQQPQHNAQSLPRHFCRNAKDMGEKGLDPVFGCGLLQIGAALRDNRS